MRLFWMRLTAVEQGRLAKVIEKLFPAPANFSRIDLFGVSHKAPHIGFGLHGTAASQGIGVIADAALIDRLPHMAVPLIVMHGCDGTIDRDLVKIRTAQAEELGVR